MSPEKKKQIREFIDSLDRQDQIWALGFLEGMLNGSISQKTAPEGLLQKIKKLPLPTERNPAIQKKLPTSLLPGRNRKVFMPNS